MRFKVKASTFGVIRRSTQANGSITKCMAQVTSYGRTANNTLESSRRISDMEKANSSGRMEESMRAVGSAANRVESDITRTITEFARKVCGLMESARSGLKCELVPKHFNSTACQN